MPNFFLRNTHFFSYEVLVGSASGMSPNRFKITKSILFELFQGIRPMIYEVPFAIEVLEKHTSLFLYSVSEENLFSYV